MIHQPNSDNPLLDKQMIQRKGLTNFSGPVYSHTAKQIHSHKTKKKRSARKKASIDDLLIVVHCQGQAQGQVGRDDVIP